MPRDLVFVPDIPRKNEVLRKMEMGTMNLVILLYPQVFWPSELTFFGISRQYSTFEVPVQSPRSKTAAVAKVPGFTLFMDLSRLHNRPVLMCQTFGLFAEYIETLSPQQVADIATNTLRSSGVFPLVIFI